MQENQYSITKEDFDKIRILKNYKNYFLYAFYQMFNNAGVFLKTSLLFICLSLLMWNNGLQFTFLILIAYFYIYIFGKFLIPAMLYALKLVAFESQEDRSKQIIINSIYWNLLFKTEFSVLKIWVFLSFSAFLFKLIANIDLNITQKTIVNNYTTLLMSLFLMFVLYSSNFFTKNNKLTFKFTNLIYLIGVVFLFFNKNKTFQEGYSLVQAFNIKNNHILKKYRNMNAILFSGLVFSLLKIDVNVNYYFNLVLLIIFIFTALLIINIFTLIYLFHEGFKDISVNNDITLLENQKLNEQIFQNDLEKIQNYMNYENDKN